jgi:co-chaperonin GroES (HSP10)
MSKAWWQESNKSGLHPVGRAILVKPYKPAQKDSLIYIPDAVETNMQTVDQRAVVVEVGPAAFAEEIEGGYGPRCVPGDHVMIAAYAGFMAKGLNDGVQYRYVNDRDVFAQIESEEETTNE